MATRQRPEGGTFGVDAPKVPAYSGSLRCCGGDHRLRADDRQAGSAPVSVTLIFAAFFGVCAQLSVHNPAREVRVADLLDDARLKGDEYAVDLGCGRGAVLISLAKRLTTGRVSGIDLWRGRTSPATTSRPPSTTPGCAGWRIVSS